MARNDDILGMEETSELASTLSAIDRLVHEPARLSILAVLNVVDRADFAFLLRQTGLTRGNLSSHLSKLEEASYVSIAKEFVEKLPRTLIRLTAHGRRALSAYRGAMAGVLEELED